MADVTKRIRFEADVDGLKDALRQIGPMLRDLEKQMSLKIPMQGGGILNQYGQPYQMGSMPMPQGGMGDLSQMPAYQLLQMQAKGAIAGGAHDQIKLKSIELDKDFTRLSSTLKKFEDQLDNLTKEQLQEALTAKKDLEKVKKEQADIKALGGGGGGILETLLGGLSSVGVGLPIALKATQMLAELPMQRAAARAATGQLGARNVAAGMDLTSFENLARLDPRMQDTARGAAGTTGLVRGATEGMGGWGLAGAAGIIPLLGLLGALPTGGLSLAAAGGLAGLGFAGGAVARGGLNIFSGNLERQQAMTFEERMRSETQARGPEMARYNAAMGAHGLMFPIQQTYGWGVGATGRNLGAMGGIIAGHSLSRDEFSGMMMGGAGMFGGTIGGGGGFDPNALNTMARVQRNTGLGFGELGGALGAFSGVGGNMTSGEQARNLEDILARGTSRGVTTSPLMHQYLDVLMKVAGQAAGGWGAISGGAAGAMVGTIMETTGEKFSPSVAGGAAAALGSMAKVETASGGIAGWSNAMAADKVTQKLIRAGVESKKAFAIGRMFMTADQAQLSDPRTISRWARMAGIGEDAMRGIVGGGMAQKLDTFSSMMGGLGGELGVDLGLFLMGDTTVGAAQTGQIWGPTAGKMRRRETFEGRGTQGFLSSEETKMAREEIAGKGGMSYINILDEPEEFMSGMEGPGALGRGEAVSSVPGAEMGATSLLDLLATAWSPKTLQEMATHMGGLTENLTKLNPQAELLAKAFYELNVNMGNAAAAEGLWTAKTKTPIGVVSAEGNMYTPFSGEQ